MEDITSAQAARTRAASRLARTMGAAIAVCIATIACGAAPAMAADPTEEIPASIGDGIVNIATHEGGTSSAQAQKQNACALVLFDRTSANTARCDVIYVGTCHVDPDGTCQFVWTNTCNWVLGHTYLCVRTQPRTDGSGADPYVDPAAADALGGR